MCISNMLPHTITSFDPSRQLARGDIIFSELRATIVVKWSKTIQNRKDIHTIAITSQALQALLVVTPGHNNSPLFTLSTKCGTVPLTDSVARKHLKEVSQLLGFHPHFKFHDFRRSGATWAFHQGVPLHHIMHHGSWQSEVCGNISNPHLKLLPLWFQLSNEPYSYRLGCLVDNLSYFKPFLTLFYLYFTSIANSTSCTHINYRYQAYTCILLLHFAVKCLKFLFGLFHLCLCYLVQLAPFCNCNLSFCITYA